MNDGLLRITLFYSGVLISADEMRLIIVSRSRSTPEIIEQLTLLNWLIQRDFMRSSESQQKIDLVMRLQS